MDVYTYVWMYNIYICLKPNGLYISNTHAYAQMLTNYYKVLRSVSGQLKIKSWYNFCVILESLARLPSNDPGIFVKICMYECSYNNYQQVADELNFQHISTTLSTPIFYAKF